MAVTYKRLGRHGTLVSNLCLGTVNIGTLTSEKESFALMDRALEHGINFFDTADIYAHEQYGVSEETLGRWFAQGDGRRDAIVLATKVYKEFLKEGLRPEPNRQSPAIGAVKIRRQVESSLRRLQTDVIDLYQMHHIDRECPWEETWQAFDTLVKQGKIHYVGSSNFAGWHIATACQEAARRNLMGLASEQSRYNLCVRTPELEVIPACRHYGLGLLTYSPVHGGFLGGILQKPPKGGRREKSKYKEFLKKHRNQVEQYEALCKKLGEEPAVVAQAWLLHNPAVTSVIIGPRTLEHLESSIRATEITLDEETLKQLDEIWPGPGGEAPEAYAW
jgi:aryl-alcohol dehydrogenase-like predicted oxidoreductase